MSIFNIKKSTYVHLSSCRFICETKFSVIIVVPGSTAIILNDSEVHLFKELFTTASLVIFL